MEIKKSVLEIVKRKVYLYLLMQAIQNALLQFQGANMLIKYHVQMNGILYLLVRIYTQRHILKLGHLMSVFMIVAHNMLMILIQQILNA